MAFVFEQYGVMRQELEYGRSGAVYFWPKKPGTGNLDITSATYTIKDSSGTTIETGTATLTSQEGVERVDCAVSAISAVGENYRCEIAWVYSGETSTEIVLFDVTRTPYSNTVAVSLNDLQEERPDVGYVCTQLGNLMNSKTNAQVASIFAYRARVYINRMIRERIDQDRINNAFNYDSALVGKVYSRANAIMNREDLNRLERVKALALIYFAASRNPSDPDDEMMAIHTFYMSEVDNELKSLHIQYDIDGDSYPDKTIQSGARLMSVQRRQT